MSLHFAVQNLPVEIEIMPVPPFRTFALKFLDDVGLSKLARKILPICQVCCSSVSTSHIPLVRTDPCFEIVYPVTDGHVHVDRILDIRLMTSRNECKRQLGRQPRQSNGVPISCFSLKGF